MITIEEALAILKRVPVTVVKETVALGDALGRVLAGEVISPIDSPPFDKSAMDGYAVGADDHSTEYRVVSTLGAGGASCRQAGLRPGECTRIMTGAMLPPGAGRVLRKEYVEERDGLMRPHTPEPGRNVIARGSSLRAGRPVMGPRVLAPQDIGALAASGIASVVVAIPPSVDILSTGSEVVEAGSPLGPGEIYNSNAPQLAAQLSAMRCPSRFLGCVKDEPSALCSAVGSAIAGRKVLLLTGGVSAGDFDFVPGSLARLGAEILFHKVTVKPGKPILFARLKDGWVFGLPGNPVSTFVSFELFVKPFLYRLMGIDWPAPTYRARLAAPVARREVDRVEFLPVRAAGGRVHPVAYTGSAHLNALTEADGLIRIEKGIAELPEGEEVDVRPI